MVQDDPHNRLACEARAIFEEAVRGVQADRLLAQIDLEGRAPRPLSAYRRVQVVGMGKASMAMAGVLETRLGPRIEGGAVVVPEGYPSRLPAHLSPPERIEVLEGGHPVPDARSLEAGRCLLALAERCTAEDLLVVLVSGGGTALCVRFAEELTLEAAQDTYRLLLESGADIHAMNAVRKHLSRIGGGQLARAAQPADVLALALSDVVGDDLATIASGPTVPDPTTFEEARRVLRHYALWERVPPPVRAHLDAGCAGQRAETAKPGDDFFGRVETCLAGGNRAALEAARAEAEQRGYVTHIVDGAVTGEAREVGRRHLESLCARAEGPPTCLLWGGETTVTVRGGGKGGRNQELVLGAVEGLGHIQRPAVLLSGGTDGIDGPTDAAGAWATPQTASAARTHGLNPQAFLTDNNAYAFFNRLDALVKTGPTHTNVMDVQIALLGQAT